MEKKHAAITAIGGYLPDDVLTNEDITKMVDTSDEWITTRVGIKERRILKDKHKGSSYLGIQAVKDLAARHEGALDGVEIVLCSSNTPDHAFPTTASIIAEGVGIKGAPCLDFQGACAGFLYGLQIARSMVTSGVHKKVLLVAAEKMSAIVDFEDRTTLPLFGDGSGCVIVEAVDEEVGVMDAILRNDNSGKNHLIMKAGGSACPPSHETVDKRMHYVYQEGQPVFKSAVSNMGDVSVEMMERHNLTKDDITWVVPHQANKRIIDATARRMGLDPSKVMVNIQNLGNTSSASIPLCLWQWEDQLKKGDNLILTAFGSGFTWGAVYLRWAYDYKK
ncbi:MAG: beta-ketoacyl-ACP synthase III [Porphyromonas sp.]|nr:beta-ketoacyl-ACP synthase III [Porphyromonas sp.]